jgi:NTE family protein
MPQAFLQVLGVVDPSLGEGGLTKGDRFLKAVFAGLEAARLEDLKVPFLVVATDYWAREQVVFERGALLPILEASMALPGLFTPVKHDGRLLVDGGLTNPVPFDVLHDRCDLLIAVDAIGTRTRTRAVPDALEVLFGSFQVMETAIANAKAQTKPPHIYVRLETADIPTLEWYRADEIYAQAQPAKAELKKMLAEVLELPRGAAR